MHRLQFADAEYLPRTARKRGVALPIVEATTGGLKGLQNRDYKVRLDGDRATVAD